MRTILVIAFLSTNLLNLFSSQDVRSVERESLSAVINSDISETRPYISGDGKTLFFCRRNSEENVGGEKDFMDVYVSYQNASGGWSEPTNLGGPINTKKNNAIAAIGQSSAELYVLNTFNFRNIPLYVSKPQGDGWGKLEPVMVEDYYNESKYIDIHVSEEHNVMIMAVERWDSRGDQDLYVSFRKTGNSWTKPQNLGRRINTKESDFAPFLSSDGTTLFFSSYGHKGEGADIYASRRLDDSWEKWTKPVNLGEGINTSGEEVYFSITDDFEYMYLESFAPGATNRDIIRVPVPNEVKPPEGEIDPMVIASNNLEADSTITSFSIAAIQEIDLDQIPVPISQYDSETSVATTGSESFNNGSARENTSSNSLGSSGSSSSNNNASDPANEAILANELGKGNESTSNALAMESTPNGSSSDSQATPLDNSEANTNSSSTPPSENSDTQNSIAGNNSTPNAGEVGRSDLSDINSTDVTNTDSNPADDRNNATAANASNPSGDEYTANFNPEGTVEFTPNVIRVEQVDGKIRIRYLRNLYFDVGQNNLDTEAKGHLDRVFELMSNDQSLVATLSGHSDITGSEKTNLRLSIIRANSAAEYLKSKGIPESRIQVNGFGVSQPLATNDDETEGREYNRRVEIVLEAEE